LPPDHRPSSGPKGFALRSLGVVAAYFLTARLGIILSSGLGEVSTFWPAAGVALAAVLLWGWRMALPVALASLLVALSVPGTSWTYCLLAPLGKAAAALAGLLLLRWRGLDNTLERVRDVVDLVVWGGLAACLLSATLGVSSLILSGAAPWSAWGETWLTWWMGDSMGVVLLTPVLLTWFTRPAIAWNLSRVLEESLWLALFLVVAVVVFSGWASPAVVDALDFLPVLLLFWAAVRFGRRLTSTASLFICYLAMVAAASGKGPFTNELLRQTPLILWAYLGSLAAGALCLAASLGQTRRALRSLAEHRNCLAQAVDRRTVQLVESAQTLAESEELYRTLVDESPMGVALIDPQGKYLYLNRSFTHIFGYTLQDVPHGRDWFRRAFPKRKQRHKVITTWELDQAASSTGQVRPRTFPVVCKDGALKEVLFRPVSLSNGGQLIIYEDVSQQEQAARALAQSEDRQRALLESLREGVILIASDGTVLSWNQAAMHLTDFSADQMLGKNAHDISWPLFRPDGAPCPREEMPHELTLASGKPLRGRLYLFERSDGQRRWFSINTQPLRLEGSDQPSAVSIVVSDVTESRSAHEALKASEKKFRLLADNMADVVWTLDRNRNFTYISPSVERMLGYKVAELRNMSPRTIMPPDWQEAADRIRNRMSALDQQDPAEAFMVAESLLKAKDGREVMVESVIRQLRNEQGEFIGYTGATRDITERKQAEEALAQSEQKHRALFEGANDAIFLLRDGRIVDCNPKALKMFGRRREDIVGHTPEDLSPPTQAEGEDSGQLAEAKIDAALAGRPQIFEWIHLRADGEPFEAEVNLTSMEVGGQPHVQAIVRDITKRKQAQRALAESEEKYSKVFQHSPTWVVLNTLEEARYLEVNQAFLDQTGWSREEVIGHTSAELNIRPDPDAREEIIQTIRRSGPVHNREVQRRTKDGRILTMLYSGDIVEIGGQEYLLSLVQDITERKQAEQALKASEEKFSSLYMTSPAWMALGSLSDYRYLEVNRAFEQITGYTRQEAVGRTPVELGLWPNPEHRQALMEKVKQDGKLHQEPITLRMRSGEPRHFLWSAEALQLGDESALISVLLDVTELRQAQQALAESEKSFRNVVETSLAGIYVVQDGQWSYVNPRLVQMHGFDSAEELMQRSPRELVHPDDLPLVRSIDKVREKQPLKADPYVFRGLTKDGRVIWLESMGTHATFRGRPANMGNVVDITQRLQAEQALKESEEQYRLLVSTAQDAIYILQEGKLVFANPMVERITGFSAEQLAGTHFTQLMHPEDLEMVSRRYQQRLAGEKVPDNYPMRVIGANGSVRWIQASAVTLTWKGKPAILYVARDITEQRRMEAQLRQSQKLEAVGTLAGGIAHDFNNILAAIMGYTELSLDQTPGGGPVANNLEQVITACKRARDLVSQILSFSRHSEHQLQPLMLEPLVREVLGLIRATTPSNIDITTDLTEGGLVLADPVQIHQLLMNLCTNAAQAMENGGGSIKVSLNRMELAPGDPLTGPTLPPGPYVRLSVADTGPGIPPETGDRIFEPFFTTKEPGQGSGLGLSAVHGIVQSHQGAVSLEQEPGGGAVFRVLLPEADQALHRPVTEQAAAAPGGNERILFVDDEPALVEIARNMLTRLGYQARGFTSSQEALEEFQRDPQAYDLVISDQTMPGLTGAALARKIKTRRPELPVIICTGFSHQLSPEQAAEIGVSAFVIKPITSAEIARVVRSVLDASPEAMSDKT